MAAKPLIIPDPFSGTDSALGWDEWIDHFESVAEVNKWEEADKLLWLRVRLTGRAQKAFKGLSTDAKANYEACKRGLKERFEPATKKELYQAEFYARKKQKTEDWAAFAEDLELLAEKAFPALQEEAREHLTLTQYLGQLDCSQIAFSVKQKRPKTVDEAVSATLEMESYLVSPKASRVAQVEVEAEAPEQTLVAAVQSQQETMMDMMKTMMDRLGKLEAGGSKNSNVAPSGANSGRQSWKPRDPQPTSQETEVRTPITCYRCGKEGHYARGCAVRRGSRQGN